MVMVDGEQYGRQDGLGTVAALGAWWQQLARDRQLPPVFGELLKAQVDLLARFVDRPLPQPSLASVHELATAATAKVRATRDGDDLVLPPSLRLLRSATDALRSAGAMPSRATGEIVRVNISSGGVPKRPVGEGRIERGGLVGDRQLARVHHGRPWQALCLWSAEVVDAFAADGHPLAYGSAGENMTVRGIDWSRVQAGVQMRLGSALVECTLWSLPCKKNGQWFLDGQFDLMHHDRGPVSRIYARVLEAGDVHPGAVAILEPFADAAVAA